MEVILYSIITMFAFGVSNAFTKPLVEEFGALRASVLRSVFTVPFLFVAMYLLSTKFIFDWKWILISVLITFIGYAGYIAFMNSLKYGKPGLVVPIGSGRVIVMSFIGFVFLGEDFSIAKLVMVSVIFLGIVLASVNLRELKKSDFLKWNTGVPLALLAALGLGLAMPFYKLPSIVIGPMFTALIGEVAVLCFALMQGVFLEKTNYLFNWKTQLRASLNKRMLIIAAVVGIGTGIAAISLNLAFMTGYISIASSVGGASGLVTIALAAIFFKERLSIQQYIAAGFIFIGILLPAFFNII